jgi:hypothetical protein
MCIMFSSDEMVQHKNIQYIYFFCHKNCTESVLSIKNVSVFLCKFVQNHFLYDRYLTS